jgi:hypothetical protein
MIGDLFNTDRILFIFLIYLGLSLTGIWISLVFWTSKDITTRSRSWIARILAPTLVFVFCIFGLIIYLLLRPKKTMDDEFREKLNEEVLIYSLVKPRLCSECQQEISSNWLYCPSCKKQLRKPCVICGNNLDVSWELCPFCGAENLRTFKDLAEDK